MNDDRVDPGAIMALSTGFWDSQVLLTANRLGVFAALAGGVLELDSVCRQLNTDPRATGLLLNACVGLDLLRRDGNGYVNSPASNAFLVPGKVGYLGNAIRYSDNLYATWGQLEQAVRSGQPQMPSADYLGGDASITRDFVFAMHDRALGVGSILVDLIDMSDREQLLDIGGGPGTYASLFARKYPQLRAVVLDLPGIVAHADEIINSLGAGSQVATLAGSYYDAAFPQGNDVVLLSGVLHRESEAQCRMLLDRSVASLQAGGMLVVSDVFTDHTATSPPFATLFGLNMLLTAKDGGVHQDAAMGRWMAQAGLDRIEIKNFPPPMPHRVVVGIKP